MLKTIGLQALRYAFPVDASAKFKEMHTGFSGRKASSGMGEIGTAGAGLANLGHPSYSF
jgi:hypothetical protein